MSAKQKALGRTLEFYKNLPMELRTLALIAGIFVPTFAIGSIFYFVQDITGIRNKWVSMAILIGVILLITIIVFLINGVTKWRGRAKAKRIGKDMLTEQTAARPTSMSQREAIKANNEKFEKAVAEMKQTYGVSVYTLPWYIVIGESGCGKTRLINESNLEFPSGKPEGHTVGTLNYNWWFTQDMVFLDMAGRLVNPAEDKDHAEWLGVLRTIRKGRPRCPLNGALVCISADEDLLNVTPEKLRANADNMLLRLRELQRELGVTFPVYLVVTKCDKLLGFMDFFGRVTGKLALSTQMVGWSREGEEFNAAYDPDNFKKSFEELYQRVHQFRLRRLRDDVDDQVRSAAYCFPEEFAQLRDPLLVYINTLFPYLKNQLVVKNLIFRGVYFTSATQQSEAVLGHLRNKLGEDAAKALARLSSLYSQPEPRFVKELLQKKVEPENGLVYRNEAQLQRNRRAARLLQVCTAVLAVMAAAGFWWSYRSFKEVVKNPREHARETHWDKAPGFVDNGALVRTAELAKDSDEMSAGRARWLARVLSMGLGTDEPANLLGQIRLGFMHRSVFPLVASQVKDGISAGFSFENNPDALHTYVDGLVGAVRWWSASSGSQCIPDCVQMADLQAMAQVAAAPKSEGQQVSLWDWRAGSGTEYVLASSSGASATRKSGVDASFSEMAERYFRDIEPHRRSALNPAHHFRAFDAVVKDGVKRLADYRKPWARLAQGDESFGNPELTELMNMARDCRAAQREYEAFLAGCGNPTITTAEEYDQLVTQVKSSATKFHAAITNLRLASAAADDKLWQLLCDYRQRNWGEIHDRLTAAVCTPSPCSDAAAAALPNDLAQLDEEFWLALRELGLVGADEPFPSTGFSAKQAPPASFLGVTKGFPHIVRLEPEQKRFTLTEESVRVASQVKEFADGLQPPIMVGGTVVDWAKELRKQATASERLLLSVDEKSLNARWKPTELNRIGKRFAPILHAARGTMLLESLAKVMKAGQEAPNRWFIAAWESGEWQVPVKSAYAITAPPDVEIPLRASASAPDATARASDELSIAIRSAAGARSVARDQNIPRCCTRALLTRTAAAAAQLHSAIQALQPETHFLPTASANPQQLQSQLQALWQRYAEAYAESWRKAVDAQTYPNDPRSWEEVVRFSDSAGHQAVCALVGDFLEHVGYARYVDRQTGSDLGVGWLRTLEIDKKTTAAVIMDNALATALESAFPQMRLPDLPEQTEKAPWAVNEVQLDQAWSLLRKDIGDAEQLRSSISATIRPDTDRFQRMSTLVQAACWPALPALVYADRFEDRACQLLADVLGAELRNRTQAANARRGRERCDELKRLRDQAFTIADSMGRCAQALRQNAPDPGLCCAEGADRELDAVAVSFSIVPEGALESATGQASRFPTEQRMSTCYGRVRVRAGAQEVVFGPLDPAPAPKLVTLGQLTSLQLVVELPVSNNEVEVPTLQPRTFANARDFLAYLKTGKRQGDSFTTTETLQTTVKKTGEKVFVRQAITWTLSGRVAGVSAIDFLEQCGG